METTPNKIVKLTDPISNEHQEEVSTMAGIFTKFSEALKNAKTYEDLKKAMDETEDTANNSKDTGLMDLMTEFNKSQDIDDFLDQALMNAKYLESGNPDSKKEV